MNALTHQQQPMVVFLQRSQPERGLMPTSKPMALCANTNLILAGGARRVQERGQPK
jgi:hypothetical protein